ncbi:hypothetical protein PQO03_05470 [Lentisphaera profundi]|uniref:Transporter n=1 Tax=Lentisphaera profundi TaxID=1658616 RepID=A0ABY7VT73_9BACT|nr:hypothetical protein [Lentisphaera profundi]WDE97398.1 hypothetical protein PQO03_05470 [Lentisphaera profundi]
MLSIYDYIVIGFYFAFIMSLGYVFKRFNGSSADYFAGGSRMSWWLVGLSAFVANFSCWTFTGAAGLAYEYGFIVFVIYICDVVGYILGYSFFAKRYRQMRLVTAMDAVRARFGKASEQIFTWIQVPIQVITAGVWLVGLSIILSSVFNLPQAPVVIATGIVVLVMSLFGGSWAVNASDFIQGLLLVSISVAAGVLCLTEIGSISAFIDQIPKQNMEVIHPTGHKYDWIWILAMIGVAIINRNNIVQAAKYIAVKDGKDAKKAAAIPLFLYILLPVFWFIPPLCANTIAPGFIDQFSNVNNPSEVAYIATCLKVLPQGMIGLLVAGLFAATMSSMDTGLNRNAGFLTKNFYAKIIRPEANDKELLRVGQIFTALMGITVIIVAMIFINMGKISLFDVVLTIAAMLSIPVFVPLFLGILFKGQPKWADWSTVLLGFIISALIYKGSDSELAMSLFQSINAEDFLIYMREHKMTFNVFVNIPVSTLWFLSTKYIPHKKDAAYDANVEAFFTQMNKEVDFEKEIGHANDKDQAKVLGWLSCVYGAFVLILLFIPNSMSARWALFGCGGFMMSVGLALIAYSRKSVSEAAIPIAKIEMD